MSTLSFQPSCPSGGTWYACGNGTQFVGCCGKYACTNTGCPAGLLYPASFLASAYGTFPDQLCDSGQWYTCSGTTPPFMGCCSVNPCAAGSCPSSSLQPGRLSGNPTVANQFNPQPPLAGASSSSAPTSATTIQSTSTTSLPTSSTATSVPTSTPSPVPTSTPTAAIAGGAAGGVLLIVAIVALIWWRRSRKKKPSSVQHGAEPSRTDVEFPPYGGKMAVVGVREQYHDSPGMAPPYSYDSTPLPRYPSPNQHQVAQGYGYGYGPTIIHEADTSHYLSQSPPSQASPYDAQSSQSSPPISQIHSGTWRSMSSPTETARMSGISQFSSPEFARTRQGPPQEMSAGAWNAVVGLGVQNAPVNQSSPSELDGGQRQNTGNQTL